ncbi:MAG TPA: hypothetical protein VMS12_11645 [Thermoanaerobaculia bacterium]|nr:hypothetical protein [Thermoanaerobaculia bacterium]
MIATQPCRTRSARGRGQGTRARRAMLMLCLALSLIPGVSRAATTESSPQELWFIATEAIREGDRTGAESTVQQILLTGRSVGVTRFPVYADATAAYAMQAFRAGNDDLAQWSLRLASTLDPKLPDVDFTAADMAYARSDWRAYGESILGGFRKSSANYRTRLLATSDLILVTSAALAITITLFALLLFYRYGRAAAHDFCEVLSTKSNPRVSAVLGWGLLFAPLFVWLGPTWLILYWLALFFGYATRAERAVIIGAIVIMGILPLVLAWTSFRISGIDSPVIQAAVASAERSLNPEPLRRLEQLAEIMPDEPLLYLLMGDLEVQQANERAAAQHYRRAIDLDERVAGAQLNLGNLYFFENDFQTASLQYERAAQLDPSMAIAYYNHAVASGELYKFSEQGQQLAEARDRDRASIAKLLGNPPLTKVVMHEFPVGQAWNLAERIARSGDAREIYGNHALFEPAVALRNPLTLAAILALALAILLWVFRRKNGFAGECQKCGRTFCFRCKASRESASYCTQCIHIYLKRDGVSLETKRDKIQEVQDFQAATQRRKKILSALAPGAGHIIGERTLRGVGLLLLFVLFVTLALLIGNLAPLAAPAPAMKMSVRMLAIGLAALVWIVAFISMLRHKSTAS